MTECSKELYVIGELILVTRNITWDIFRYKEEYDKEELYKSNVFIGQIMDSIHNLPEYIIENNDFGIEQDYLFMRGLLEKVDKISHMYCYEKVKSQLVNLIEKNL